MSTGRRCVVAFVGLVVSLSLLTLFVPSRSTPITQVESNRPLAEFGRWNFSACDACDPACYRVDVLSAQDCTIAVRDALDSSLRAVRNAWQEGILLDHHVKMVVADSGQKGSVHNAIGIWLHIVGFNVTVLRARRDRHGRFQLLKRFFERVVARSHAPFPPTALYMSNEDIPISGALPYFSLFTRRDMRSFLVPDILLGNGAETANWTLMTRHLAEVGRRRPLLSRKPQLFFRGAPTHGARRLLHDQLNQKAYTNLSEVLLAPFDNSKLFPIANHTESKYLLAIRGKSASIRDKLLMPLGSVILWHTPQEPHLGDESPDSPLFQMTHLLLKPFVSVVPLTRNRTLCTLEALESSALGAANIAENAVRLISALSEALVEQHVDALIRAYGALHKAPIPHSPGAYLRLVLEKSRELKFSKQKILVDGTSKTRLRLDAWAAQKIDQLGG